MTTQSTNGAPPTAPQELIPYQDLSVGIPGLVDKMNNAIVSAKAAVEKLPEITDDETKQKAFDLMGKIKGAFEQYNGFRMPFTRMLDQITKKFTSAENEAKSICDGIQAKLNAYAKKQLDEQRLKEHENQKKLKAEQRKIELEGNIKLTLVNRVNEFLEVVRKAAGAVVDEVTKETLVDKKKALNVEPKWTQKMETKYFTAPDYLEGDEEGAKFLEIAQAEYEGHKTHYATKGKEILADSIALLDVAVNNREEAQRMKDAQANQLQQEQEEQKENITAKIDADVALSALDQEQVEQVKAKTTYKIEVKSNVGWMKIIAFNYEHDPKAKTELWDTKTMKSFKTFAERKFNKDSTKVDHADVVYVEDVKAKE
jgi:hypothetical protein